ncbi:MAG: sigma-70 family RNA polymerase sigma factor [Planctomycetes bacterium]|nr:sigma-70 family RNA polymerase sigma factor [Planctomycetota bacterium]
MQDPEESPPGAAKVQDLLSRGIEEPQRAEELLPLVYDELRRLAAARLGREGDAHSLQPTALVHDAYLRLLGSAGGAQVSWNGKRHFFGAAALAMRRILVERARRRRLYQPERLCPAVAWDSEGGRSELSDAELIDLDAALGELEQADKRRYDIVMARFFGGLSVEDTALALGISERTVIRDWSYARAWLLQRMSAP